MVNIRKLEAELWESADMLRSGSKLTSNQYCMPVLGLIFLRYAFSRFKRVEQEILANRPMRNGRKLPVEASDFKAKSAIFLPREAQYDYLVNLPANAASFYPTGINGNTLGSLGEVVNNAMELIEQQSEQLHGVLPKNYTIFADELLSELLRIFNNSALSEVGGDVIGRIYEYFLNKFAKNVASDDGVFFTPKSLVKMIVNVLEPKEGILLDPACGSGGMFVQTGDFVEQSGMEANSKMTFYGQEKVEYNAQLCLMNMAVHGLTGVIKSGDAANSFYHDAHNLDGCCDYVMANPPFNVDKVNKDNAVSAGRLPFGIPGVDKSGKSFSNANYLWISYFYSYLNEKGRAGFVMASSATDSSRKEKDIRQKIVETGHVDVMVSVANNFFYTLSLPCSLWFFNKGKAENLKDKVLFIDARNYYTVVDRTLNEWSEWQLRNLGAIVWLYRGETENYKRLIQDYWRYFSQTAEKYGNMAWHTEKPVFEDVLQAAKSTEATYANSLKQQQEALKATKKRKEKSELKAVVVELEAQVTELREAVTVAEEAVWLTSKFGNDGVYQDIPGLCRIATIAQIAEKDYSLTPGAYVGVAETEDDGVDFTQRMNEIHTELAKLQAEANQLMTKIQQNWEALK